MDGLILEFFYFKFGGNFIINFSKFLDIYYSELKCPKGPVYKNP